MADGTDQGIPSAVLFDVDDTLVDFGGAARLALADVVLAHLAADDVEPSRLLDAAHLAWQQVSDTEYDRFTAGEVDFEQMRLNRMAAFLAAIDRPGADRLSHGLLVGPDEGGGAHGYTRRALNQPDDEGVRSFSAFRVGPDEGGGAHGYTRRALNQPDDEGVRSFSAFLEEQRNAAIFGHFRVFDDVPECLQRLRDQGVTVRVLSNSDGDYQRIKLAAVGLGELGDTGFYSGELGVAKPDPRIFHAAADALGLRADQISYVGDRWAVDVVGSAAAGMRPIWLNRTGLPRPAERPSSTPSPAPDPLGVPVVEIASLAELDIGP